MNTLARNYNLLKHLVCTMVILTFPFSTFAANDTFFHLWKSTGTTTGSLNYIGNAFGNAHTTLTNMSTGNMSISYSLCQNMTGNTKQGARDTWIFIPKKIQVGGKSLPIKVTAPPGFEMNNSINDYVTLVERTPVMAGPEHERVCWEPGYAYALNIKYPNLDIAVDVTSLGVGKFTGDIPVRYSHAEYFSYYPEDIKKFSDNLAFEHTTVNDVPYNIEINNNCNLTSLNDISLAHGEHSISSASGSVETSTFNINCEQAASIKLKLIATTASSNKYTDGIGVSLGNGWDSSLTIRNSTISDSSSSEILEAEAGNNEFTIQSTLKATNSAAAGSLEGSAVLSAEIQ